MRHLNLHEYQSKRLMERYGVNTQRFKMAVTAQEAGEAAKELGLYDVDILDIHFYIAMSVKSV